MTAIKNYKLRNVEKPNLTKTHKNKTGQKYYVPDLIRMINLN